MDKLLELRQKQADLIAKMRALVEAADTAQRSLTEEEQANYDDLRSQLETLKRAVEQEEELRNLEGGVATPRNLGGGPAIITNPKEDLAPGVRMARCAKIAMVAQQKRSNPMDIAKRIYPQDTAIRSLIEGTAESGGIFVPANVVQEVIPLLRATGAVRAMGITSVPLTNGNLKLPKQTGAANFKWVGENSPIGNSTPGLGSIDLKAKKLAGIIPISNELLADGSIAADMFVRDEMINGIAEAEDISALYGTGNENQPKGILTACDTNAIDVGAMLSDSVIAQMMGTILSKKLTNPSLGWMFGGQLWTQLWSMVDGNGRYIYRDEMKDGRLLGVPFKINNNFKVGSDANGKTAMVLGDWKNMIIGETAGIDISVSTEASYQVGNAFVSAYENDLTLMRAIMREDFGIRYEEAFVVAKNVFTVPTPASPTTVGE